MINWHQGHGYPNGRGPGSLVGFGTDEKRVGTGRRRAQRRDRSSKPPVD
jgi:hypothetical protein